MSEDLKRFFLGLVRLGAGHIDSFDNTDSPQLTNEAWGEIVALAERQGLSGIIADGLERVPQEVRPPKPVILQLIGEVLQGGEYRYELYRRAIAEMASFYNSYGFRMMILKGYGCSLNWPKPEHRPVGDIDIWQFGQQKEADMVLAQVKGGVVDNSHHHHTVFHWRDFMVENHYDFINVHHHKSNPALEKIFKELGQDDSHFVELYGEKVYLPSPNLFALFLLRHTMVDFASGIVTLRQVLDWAFFMEKHGSEVDWLWMQHVLEQFHMRDFFDCLNVICVEDLGFAATIFSVPGLKSDVDKALKERALNEILFPKFSLKEPKNLFPRLFYKYRRWLANKWKHQMCYKESMWSAFWSGVWNHLLKPSSI